MTEFDDELTDEELAAVLKHAMQEMNAGFYYSNLVDENGKWTGELQCNKCKRVAQFGESPFPHKYECPMRK